MALNIMDVRVVFIISRIWTWDENLTVREVVKTTILKQDPQNHKIDGGLYLQPPFLNLKR